MFPNAIPFPEEFCIIPVTSEERISRQLPDSSAAAVASGAFEPAFLTRSLQNPQITGSGTTVSTDFDVAKMQWGGVPIRRSARPTVPTCVEFWGKGIGCLWTQNGCSSKSEQKCSK
tara:strand:- start:1934 stop:2281 length:348 start_codon:yes stop_codon:yes gene_type:complete